METAAPIILGILAIIIAFLILCWILITAWYDEILDFIANIKPFSAKAVYKRNARRNVRETKRNCRYNTKILKRRIQNERNQIKEEINNSIGYCCYIDIIYKENINWLKKKDFKITEIKDKTEYKISWSDTKNDSQI